MDNSNMPKRFQQILMYTFREIELYHLQPFLNFLDNCASIFKFVSWGDEYG